MNAIGMDISHYEGNLLDWKKAKDAGISFAFIKATERTDYYDDCFVRNWAMASTYGILKGAYHYYRSKMDPELQARWFLRNTGGGGDLPHVIDLEDPWLYPPIDFANRVRLFLGIVQIGTNKVPIIYTNLNTWQSLMRNADWGDKYPLWIANPRMNSGPTVPYPWAPTNWTFWQWTWNGSPLKYGVPIGGKKAIDLDVFNGTEAQLKEWAATH